MNYYPLFRVRSWNNGVHCMSLYVLTSHSSLCNPQQCRLLIAMRDLCHLLPTGRTRCCRLQGNGILLFFFEILFSLWWQSLWWQLPQLPKLWVEIWMILKPQHWKLRAPIMPNLASMMAQTVIVKRLVGPVPSWQLSVFNNSLLFVQKRFNFRTSAMMHWIICTKPYIWHSDR